MTTITTDQAKTIIRHSAVAYLAHGILGHDLGTIPVDYPAATTRHLLTSVGRVHAYRELATLDPTIDRYLRAGADIAHQIESRYRTIPREPLTDEDYARLGADFAAFDKESYWDTDPDKIDVDLYGEIVEAAAEAAAQ